MEKSSAIRVKEAGIVGAGGAGFPTYVKLSSPAEIVLVNAAECEPLLHKDKELLSKRSGLFFTGLQFLMEQVGAEKAIIGIKEKHSQLIEQLRSQLTENIEIIPVEDFYPAGDEITLIYETTGRVVAAGSLPGSQGIIVNNVETICNICAALPVTSKFLNVTGAVANPVTIEVPIGISFQELIDFAKPTIGEYAVIEGGPMMGKLTTDLSQPVTKTTAALIILPKEHVLVRRLNGLANQNQVNRIGKAACDQCMQCTDLCPRYLLGHPVQAHVAMRSLLFSGEGQTPQTHTGYCCECNLCSFVACPENLSPSQVCIDNKHRARDEQLEYAGTLSKGVHPMREFRKTPSKKLKSMLDLNRFEDLGPLVNFPYQPLTLKVGLRQHIGHQADPIVKVGDTVSKGQKIASVGSALGCEVHAPLNAVVSEVHEQYITLAVCD